MAWVHAPGCACSWQLLPECLCPSQAQEVQKWSLHSDSPISGRCGICQVPVTQEELIYMGMQDRKTKRGSSIRVCNTCHKILELFSFKTSYLEQKEEARANGRAPNQNTSIFWPGPVVQLVSYLPIKVQELKQQTHTAFGNKISNLVMTELEGEPRY